MRLLAIWRLILKDTMMVFKCHFKNGQSTLEYAVLAATLCLVFLTMFVYMRRAVQSRIYGVETVINNAVEK